MVDKVHRFPASLLKVLSSLPHDGEQMIAISRAILMNDYQNDEYEQDMFSVFNLIVDESGEIILSGFGLYNFPTESMRAKRKSIDHTLLTLSSKYSEGCSASNSKIYWKEIGDIRTAYQSSFRTSLDEFIEYFHIVI
jgi:hypothetical protein